MLFIVCKVAMRTASCWLCFVLERVMSRSWREIAHGWYVTGHLPSGICPTEHGRRGRTLCLLPRPIDVSGLEINAVLVPFFFRPVRLVGWGNPTLCS